MTHPFLSGIAIGLILGIFIGISLTLAIIRSAEID